MEGSGVTKTLFRLFKLLSNEVQSGFFFLETKGREGGRAGGEMGKRKRKNQKWAMGALCQGIILIFVKTQNQREDWSSLERGWQEHKIIIRLKLGKAMYSVWLPVEVM